MFHIIIDNAFGSATNKLIMSHIVSLKRHFAIGQLGGGVVDRKVRSNTTCNIDKLYEKEDFVQPDGTIDWPGLRSYRAEKSPLLKTIDLLIQSEVMRSFLDSAPYPLCKFRQMNVWETRISRYGGAGEFYSWHNDKMSGDTRTVTMNYYLSRIPKRFTGGELCLTNGSLFDGSIVDGSDSVEIEPKNDRIVLFSSRVVHKVKPTKSPTRFEDGRFSVNVWVGRQGLFDSNDLW